MKTFENFVRASVDLERKANGAKKFDSGREILINAQMYLYLQVSGDSADNPTIDGGYHGRNYKDSVQWIFNLIQLIECEANIDALKQGQEAVYRISWKY